MTFKIWLAEMAQNSRSQLEQMGYEFRVENSLPKRLNILVYNDHAWVGEAGFTQDADYIQQENPNWASVWDDEQDNLRPNQIWVANVWVDPKHQRLGIASAMYQLAQEASRCTIVRTPSTTPDSDALWSQKNRPF